MQVLAFCSRFLKVGPCLMLLSFVFAPLAETKTHAGRSSELSLSATAAVPPDTLDLRDYGAVGDGETDDGPALQSALDALATAGGGILFVPAGRYAIITPVQKDFTGLATSLTIEGVESSTPVPPPTASGDELTHGLDLVSEFAPKTGSQNSAVTISGLQAFTIKDIAFIGTPDVTDDARVTLNLADIDEAIIHHCEFYGLSSLVDGGSIVQAVRSHLNIEQSVFLGSTANSGVYSPIVENLEWKGIVVANAIFADYGQRAELFSKMGYGAPYSWVNIGSAAAVTPDSPRREASFREVFLDEGGYVGISSQPYFYQPPSAPVDLIYISGLFMNVSNFNTAGNSLTNSQRVLIEKSHYGWSNYADSAINLLDVGEAIVDEVECLAAADPIRADAATGTLTVINSIYNHLESQAQATEVINSAPENDPVRHVRELFADQVGRAPDAAAHFYWSDQFLQCNQEAECLADRQSALDTYLSQDPAPLFAINGRITNESGAGMSGVTVTLSGSQNTTAQTDNDGEYHFSGLPTSGVYHVTPTLTHYTMSPASLTLTTPTNDLAADFSGAFNFFDIGGRVADAEGIPLSGVTIALSGSLSATVITGDDGNYFFPNLPADGDYAVAASRTSHAFTPSGQTYHYLVADQTLNFTGTFVAHSISGFVVNVNNAPLAGIRLSLSGWQTGTTMTDSNGNFSFNGLASERSYSIEPSHIGLVFSPFSTTYDSLEADKYVAFAGVGGSFTISGRLINSGVGLAAADVTLSGHLNATAATDAQGNYSFTNLPAGASYTITPSKVGYTFAPENVSFNNLSGDRIADFIATEFLLLIVEENGTRAAALTSVTWIRDPFSVTTSPNFGSEEHTRIVLFAINLRLRPSEDASAVTVKMEDAQHRVYDLPVELVGQVPGFDWLTQVVLKLTDDLGNVGECQVSISYGGKVSNTALITLR